MIYQIFSTSDTSRNSLILITIHFQEEVPVVNFVTTGIIRCRRCRTYVNPYVAFTDSGRKWRCNICSLLNDGNLFHH